MNGSGSFKPDTPLAMAKDDSPWGSSGTAGESGGESGGAPPPVAEPAAAPPKQDPVNPWLTSEPEPAARRSASIDDIFRKGRGGGPGLPDSARPHLRWLPLIGVGLVGGWLLSTCVHMLAQDERGLVTTLGRYTQTVGPGLQLTLPWPVQALTSAPTGREVTTLLPEKDAETLMATRDGELIDLSFQIRWKISDLKQFTYDLPEGEAAIRRLADAEMRASVAELPFDAVWGGKQQAELQGRVLGRVQRVLSAWHAGVSVAGIEVLRAAPPGRLADTFQKISAAREGARKNHEDAERYSVSQVKDATTEAEDFDRLYAQYKLAPAVTRQRMYYEMMDRVLANNPVVVGGSGMPAPQPPGSDAVPPLVPAAAATPQAGQ